MIMASLTKIGFAGSYKCDLLLYFARIAGSAGKKVMLVDSTDEQLLPYSVPNTFNDNITTYGNCDIYSGCNNLKIYEQLDFSNYDILFIDYGFNEELAHYMLDCNEIIFVSNLEKYNVLKLRGYIESLTEAVLKDKKEDINIIKIYRDIVKSKIDKRYIDSILALNEILDVKGEYLFYFDEVDYKIRIESQYDDNFRFNKLMKEHRVMFSEILGKYLDLKDRKLNKAIRKAGRRI